MILNKEFKVKEIMSEDNEYIVVGTTIDSSDITKTINKVDEINSKIMSIFEINGFPAHFVKVKDKEGKEISIMLVVGIKG